jgi:hypothetical protein
VSDSEGSLASTNGLSLINGLTSTNGLSLLNGLSMVNGLSTAQGLSSTQGLMTTASGRTTVSYIVKCALPAGHTLQKRDQYGTSYSFPGLIGLAPGWENGASTQADRFWVSSCLMAHINTTGNHIAIWLDAAANSIGWGRSSSYPVQEGTFVGDLFRSPPVGRYCGGRGYGSNIVAGRIGDTGQGTVPYQVVVADNGSTRCDASCSRDSTGSGYTACADGGLGGTPITVWRQFISPPDISFESNVAGFVVGPGSQPTTLSASWDSAIDGSRSLLANISAPAAGDTFIQLSEAKVVPGKDLTIFFRIPVTTSWSYIQAFVQDGGAKNWRWTGRGYPQNQVIPGEWSSMVVTVPTDFAASGSRIGVALHATAPGTIKLYLDAVFLH